jgi:hypothetical protein
MVSEQRIAYDSITRHSGVRTTVIELKHLRKEFDDLVAVQDLSLRFPKERSTG